jgi:hypothetical protein
MRNETIPPSSASGKGARGKKEITEGQRVAIFKIDYNGYRNIKRLLYLKKREPPRVSRSEKILLFLK